jgi:uncharacterized membrane protein YgdD (TMEM256/DUF423 family)
VPSDPQAAQFRSDPARRVLALSGLLLALATACGAFGAHSLQAHLAPERLRLWETAVRYQFFNSLGLLGVGLTMRTLEGSGLHLVAVLLLTGVLLFSGSLYALSLGGPRLLGVLTPLGGLAWIGAWLLYARAVWRH